MSSLNICGLAGQDDQVPQKPNPEENENDKDEGLQIPTLSLDENSLLNETEEVEEEGSEKDVESISECDTELEVCGTEEVTLPDELTLQQMETVRKLQWFAIRQARLQLARKYFYNNLRMPDGRILPHGMAFPVQPTQKCPLGLQNLIYEYQLYFQPCMQEHWTKELREDSKYKERYHILNSEKRRVFYAVEEWVSNTRWHLSGGRPFIMKILDYKSDHLFTIQRHWTLSLFFWAGTCFGSPIEVIDGEENLVGIVRQRLGLLHSTAYDIEDAEGNLCIKIRKRFPFLSNSREIQIWKVGRNGNEVVIGRIAGCEYGLGISNLPAAANVTFPVDLYPELKSLLLATLIVLYLGLYQKEERCSNLSDYKENVIIRMDPNDMLLMNPSSGNPQEKWPGWKILILIGIFFATVVLLLLKNVYKRDVDVGIARTGLIQSLRDRL